MSLYKPKLFKTSRWNIKVISLENLILSFRIFCWTHFIQGSKLEKHQALDSHIIRFRFNVHPSLGLKSTLINQK
ncbi:hypothetical protein RRG08_028343 [Elysia crispata]|uniref:Uncharacterized protein n=1 Tax=Elysia crispata TaxID=231223 RepID=A0AAE1AWF6_9GAST|nr:hypothetical protein RRG08_028343 [Elysia crispata]